MTPGGLSRLLAESRHAPGGLVPVVGTGLNNEAARIEAADADDDWASLVDGIAHDTGMTAAERAELPQSFLARWERLVIRWAQAHQLEPFQAERQLEKRVVERLREREQAADQRMLYREFAEAGLADIISLNFDRRIARAAAKEIFDSGPKDPREGPQGTTLYRHSLVTGRDGATTRIWYPHGDTKRTETLRLGIRKYGFHLGLLLEHIHKGTADWRDPWATKVINLPWYVAPENDDSDDYEEKDDRRVSWVEVFLERPLLFIGVGLSPDEWSLWWLLHLRADQTTATPAYYAHVGSLDARLRHILPTLAGLEPVRFRSCDDLWSRVRGALA